MPENAGKCRKSCKRNISPQSKAQTDECKLKMQEPFTRRQRRIYRHFKQTQQESRSRETGKSILSLHLHCLYFATYYKHSNVRKLVKRISRSTFNGIVLLHLPYTHILLVTGCCLCSMQLVPLQLHHTASMHRARIHHK